MSTHDEVARRVCDLLGKLPGVTVHGYRLVPLVAHVSFSVQSLEPVAALGDISLAANAQIEPWPTAETISAPFDFVAATSPREFIESGDLQLLGIHLAWHLHRDGLLETSEANALLRSWHAREVA